MATVLVRHCYPVQNQITSAMSEGKMVVELYRNRLNQATVLHLEAFQR